MISALKIFYSTVGRKLLMALTGLFLCAFLVEHLYGNLELYKYDSGKAFNDYTEFMTGNLFIRIVEYGLFAAIIIHALDALYLTITNRKARPVRYAMNQRSANSSWFSRNMGLTGSVILVFLVIHLREFFIPHRFLGVKEDMAYSVAFAFTRAWYSSIYIFSMVLLGAHLNHGFASAFQSLGWSNHKYMGLLRSAGTIFALIIMIGFASFPIMFFFDIGGIGSQILGR
jgi:succinate dehydrogenase / fumarate reductase, cytochrome b subunit